MTGWEIVHVGTLEKVRRFRVPGGWLYQVELDQREESTAHGVPYVPMFGWGPPVFVPEGGES